MSPSYSFVWPHRGMEQNPNKYHSSKTKSAKLSSRIRSPRSAGDSILIILPLTSTTISFISKYLTDFPNTNLSLYKLLHTRPVLYGKEREECLHHRHCRQDLRQYSRTIRSRAEVVFPIAVKANAPGMDRGYSRAGCRGSSTGSKPVQELRRRT